MVSNNRDILNELNNEMNSNEYLEMANHCKKLLEEKDKELENIKKENLNMRKIICVSYGLSRTSDLLFNNFITSDNSLITQIENLIHEIRNITSTFLFARYEDVLDGDEIIFDLENEV
tara:strand:+ start:1221 stop:1574 length:354 start_codon:yes stop_codon:yes gene_type:complete